MHTILYLHLVGALVTAALVTEVQYQARDPLGKVCMGLLTLLVGLLAWPIQLGVVLGRHIREATRLH